MFSPKPTGFRKNTQKSINQIVLRNSLRKKSPYSELSWSVFTRIWIEYGERRSIYPYSVQMWENADQNNSEYGHFLLSDLCYEILTEPLTELIIMLFKKLLKVQIQAFLLATLFSAQTQYCSTFSLINLYMLLRCCLLLHKTRFTLTESHIIFNIFVIMSWLSSYLYDLVFTFNLIFTIIHHIISLKETHLFAIHFLEYLKLVLKKVNNFHVAKVQPEFVT